MMADTYMISRLRDWAEWAERRNDGGLGHKKKVSWHVNTHPTQFAGVPEVSEECNQIDQCVVALRVESQQKYEVIMLHYRGGLQTQKQKLKTLGCSKSDYYNKINAAHRSLLGYLNDLAAGIKLPTIDVKRTA